MVAVCSSCFNIFALSSNAYSTIACPICGTLVVVGSEAKGKISIISPTLECKIKGSDEDMEIKIESMDEGTEKAMIELQKKGWKMKFDKF